MIATPTGAHFPSGDFLQRLALAEVRDTNRINSSRPGSSNRDKSQRKQSGVSFHAAVVTGMVPAPDVDRTCCENGVTMYSPKEEQDALMRMMVKQHLRECTSRADPETRARLNAAAADEAWRRADALWVELRSFEADGLGARQAELEASDALKQRQREARCAASARCARSRADSGRRRRRSSCHPRRRRPEGPQSPRRAAQSQRRCRAARCAATCGRAPHGQVERRGRARRVRAGRGGRVRARDRARRVVRRPHRR